MANEELEVRAEIDGLRDFVRDLRRLDKDLPKELTKANKLIAERVVLPAVQRRARQSRTAVSGNPTRLGSRGESTIRAGARQRAGYIRGGGARAPHFEGHEWGSSGEYPQFPPASPEGHIIHPAVQERIPDVIETYGEILDEVIRPAFPD